MAGRADNGEGSCRKITSGKLAGKWRVQYILEDARGAKKRLSRVFPTQREGKEFLREIRRDGSRLRHELVSNLTFGEWFDWLCENDWPESIDSKTLRDRRARFNKYAEERWGKVKLTQIDPVEVKQYYSQLKDAGVGQHTIIALKSTLVRAFNQAITPYSRVPHYWRNPFTLDLPTPERRIAVALTPEQARIALGSKQLDDKRRAMLGVFLLAGLRLGEQMALTVGQVQLDKGLILVDRAVKLDQNSAQIIGLPKGGKIRTAVMCQALQLLLEPLILGRDPDEYIWSAASENKPRMKALTYATWRRIKKEAGLPEDMSPHDCRLTHINWIEKLCPQVSVTTLKEHVGHAASGVTEVNYTRPITPSQTLLRCQLDSLFDSD